MSTDRFSQKLHELLPVIRERRAEIEEARRLPKDLVEELAATGIFRLGIPAVFGGDEADPLDLMRAIEVVSGADGSTGWCAMVGVDAGIIAGMMPEAGVADVFADIDAPKAQVVPPSGTAVRDDGGFVVEGRWRFASGVTHADWVMAGCVVLYDGQPRMTEIGLPEVVHVWLPARDVEIHDTWHVNGLRGTGSHDFSASGVFVPEQRSLAFFDPSTHRSEPLVRLPIVAAFSARVAAVAVGIARAALDELTVLAAERFPTLGHAPLAQKPVFQFELARARGALNAARSAVYDGIEDLWQTTLAGRTPTMLQIAEARTASVHAVETAAGVAQRANILAGGPAVYTSSSIQRHARDADAVAHHFVVAPQAWEDTGRVLAGLDPGTPVF